MSKEQELIRAVQTNDSEAVKDLLAQGADVNFGEIRDDGYSNVTPLMHACGKGNIEMVDLLLRAGANVKAKDRFVMPSEGGGETALHYAVNAGHLEIVSRLVQAGANINAKAGQATVLCNAVRVKNIRLAQALLSLGANPNIGSPLEIAVDRNDVELARLLLSAKADPNARRCCLNR